MAAPSDDNLPARVARLEAAMADTQEGRAADRLGVTRKFEQVDRRIKAIEPAPARQTSGAPSSISRLPPEAYRGPSGSAIDAALRNFNEAQTAIGLPEPSGLPEVLLGIQVAIGTLGLFVDVLEIKRSETLGVIFDRLDHLTRQVADLVAKQPLFQ